jgi:2-dehydro-3-deoxyphosphooctonate aldolase (KDO 8-P synthase)
MNFQLGDIEVGGAQLVLIAGPCVIESRELCFEVASKMKAMCEARGVRYVFKASFDKANRTSARTPRGGGIEAGLQVLADVRGEFGLAVTTDVHESEQCAPAARVCSILQIPAFLCRQTDLLVAAAQACAENGGAVNVKKGQFLSPEETRNIVEKVRGAGCDKVMLTERGTTFGYNNLVVDFRGLETMRAWAPVCMDATHAVQKPGGGGDKSGGERKFVPLLARAAMAVGVDALFVETHPRPQDAWSDGPNMVPLGEMERLLEECLAIRAAVGASARTSVD